MASLLESSEPDNGEQPSKADQVQRPVCPNSHIVEFSSPPGFKYMMDYSQLEQKFYYYLLPYSPADLILLNCGSSSNLSSPDGAVGMVIPSLKASSVFDSSTQDPSVNQVPYMTARIFHSKFTYTFPLLPGPKFVRLYFYPAAYSNLDISKSYFSLSANNYKLLNNFSASLTVSAITPPVDYFTKEFIITVWDNQKFELTFSPSPSSFAFINGIEIVSMPDSFYARGNDNPLTYVDFDFPFYLDNTTALETVYRLNVGGQDINSIGDTGMYRTWNQDSGYLLGSPGNYPYLPGVKIKYTAEAPAYSAPVMVYSTMRSMGPEPNVNKNYNLTWLFPVDAGFHYLLRLHFCETRQEVKTENDQVFLIFINNQTAEYDADVIHMSGGNGIPVYKDYISKQDLWLALHPNTETKPRYADAILNGLEIFKLNTTDGNLAGLNPEPTVAPPPAEKNSSLQERRKGKRSPILLVIGIVGGSIGAVIACSLIIYFFAFKYQETPRPAATISSSLPSDLADGYIKNGSIAVAIKRLDSSSNQGAREFHAEIKILSNLRHRHLVSLTGYCDDHGEMILVYDYMSRGTLREHLYKTKSSPLPWKQRLEICIGAAKGLHYLHSGAKHTIIHRDVKSTNILLDENLVAKVSDFGLSRLGPTSTSQTHVSTVVKGSFGYMDPEYYRRQHLTEKSDVYSFGVVLFEVLCARPPVIPSSPNEKASLAEWARKFYQRGTVDQIVDPHLKGEAALFNKLLRKNPNSVDGINMEYKSSLSPHRDVMATDEDDMFSGAESHSRSRVMATDEASVTLSDPVQRARSESVFSEIIEPKGKMRLNSFLNVDLAPL
uniref:Protein kinase domain-containing protein n=2 Tax=Salix viminalis TaxID=40686 RepID=A0A6N2MZT6_SALVM